jgi:hypothetical protein
MTKDKSNVIPFGNSDSQLAKIQIPKTHINLIYKATDSCYSVFMQYMANVSYEQIEDMYEGKFSDIDQEKKNTLLAKGMEIHFAELTANTYLKKGCIDVASFITYFEDFYSFAEKTIKYPFLNLKQFNELNLNNYVDEATTAVNYSTLDPFWIGFYQEGLNFEKEVNSSVLLALDFSHVLFDNFVENITEITADSKAELDSLNGEETRALFKTLFSQHFEALLVKSSNSAINEFCNIIIDPSSKVMMKVMRYLEEGTLTFLQSHHFDFSSTFKGSKDIRIIEDVVESFVGWLVKNQDIDSFTLGDIKTLQLEDKLNEYKPKAYDFVLDHSSSLSGMDPEERVVAIHARYMFIYDIYRRFMYSTCKYIEVRVNTLLKNRSDFSEDKELQSLKNNATILIHQNEFTAEAIIKASYETWDELYPKVSLTIELEGDTESDGTH